MKRTTGRLDHRTAYSISCFAVAEEAPGVERLPNQNTWDCDLQ